MFAEKFQIYGAQITGSRNVTISRKSDSYVSRNLTMNLINLFLINYTWMVFTFENSFLYFVFYIISFIFYVRILLYF